MRTGIATLLSLFIAAAALAQNTDAPATAKALASHDESTDRGFEQTVKDVDDVLWYFKTGDVANIDKVLIASSKPVRMKNPTAQGAGNPLIIPVYVFTPKNLKGRAPLIVFVHGGVHGESLRQRRQANHLRVGRPARREPRRAPVHAHRARPDCPRAAADGSATRQLQRTSPRFFASRRT